MKKSRAARLLAAVLSFALSFSSIVVDIPVAHALIADGADAIDMVGQTDGDWPDPQPYYDKGTLDDGDNPSGRHLSGSYGSVFDPVNHRFYVSNLFTNRVLVYELDVDDTFPDRAPDYVLGQPDFTTTSAGTTQAKLNHPGHMAIDTSGDRLFVVDNDNARVMVFDVASITNGENAVAVIGQSDYTTGDGAVSPVADGFGGPAGIAIDETGDRLFISDYSYGRVLVFDIATLAEFSEDAVNVLGQANLTSGLNQTTQNGLYGPASLYFDDANDRLFVSDGAINNRVMVFDVASITNGEPAVGALGTPNFTTSAAATTQSRLDSPRGLAYDDATDRLFVADWDNDRVMVFDAASTTPGENAINVIGQEDFDTGSTFGAQQDNTDGPYDVAFDPTNDLLLVSETDNARIIIYDVAAITDGENAVDVLGQADFSGGNSGAGLPGTGLFSPRDSVIDTVNHRLYVADDGNSRVAVYDLNVDNTIPDYIQDAWLGQIDELSSEGVGSQAVIGGATGLAVDMAGDRLFVSDGSNNRVLVFDVASITNGENAANVLGQENYVDTDPQLDQDGLNDPKGLHYDAGNDRLYVADSSNSRVMVFDVASITNGEDAIDVMGQGTGYPDAFTSSFTVSGGNGSPGKLGFDSPRGTAFDPTGHRLFVTDTFNHRVLVFNLNVDHTFPDRIADFVLGQPDFNTNESDVSQSGFNNPHGIAFDDAGDRLFVADNSNNRVMVFDVASITNGENAVNVLGQPDFDTDAYETDDSSMGGPSDVAYDPTGDRLFVVDNGNSRVMVFSVSAISDGEAAVNVLGQENFLTADAETNVDSLSGPYGAAFRDSDDRLFVSDSGNHRVVVFNVASITNGEDAENVLGQPDFDTADAETDASSLFFPVGLSLNNTDSLLYVADRSNSRIMVFNVAAVTDGESAVSVLGQEDFSTSNTATDQDGLYEPQSATYDPTSDKLLVADQGNYRIIVYDVAAITDGEDAVNALGQTNGVPGSLDVVYTSNDVNDGANAVHLNVPYDVALDPVNHRLFVADSGNYRVLMYDLDSNDEMVDEVADLVLGQEAFGQVIFETDVDSLSEPRGITYDEDADRLIVADYGNHRIVFFDVSTPSSGDDAVNVLGQPDFDTAAAETDIASLSSPAEVSYDPDTGRLYVTDSQNHRVMVFDAESAGGGGPNEGDPADVAETVKIDDATTNGPALADSDFYGVSIANLGDLDADGVEDMVVGDDSDDTGGTDRGAVYIHYMNDDGSVDSTVKIDDTTANGPVLADEDRYGSSVANVGDLDGDGVTDIVVGALGDDTGGGDRGAVYVHFMNTNGSIDSTVKIDDTTANGAALSDADTYGISVAALGDLDGDSVEDIAVGASADDTSGTDRGAFYIHYLNTNGSIDSTVKIDDTTANGATLADEDIYGSSIANLGDLDDDGVIDLAVGAPGDADGGAVYIHFMNTNGSLDDTAKIDGNTANGPTVDASDSYGASVGALGDLNDDGVEDLAVGATGDDTGGQDRGTVHVHFLNDDGTVEGTFEISGSTTNGPALDDFDEYGLAVAGIGDLNDDGVLDLAVGAPGDDAGGTDRGAVHIHFMEDMGVSTNDPTLQNKITMERLKIGAVSDVAVQFVLQNELDGTLTITFPAGFTVTGAFTSGTCSGGGTIDTFAFDGPSRTLSAVKHACSGTISLSGATVTNPSTPGGYEITWVNDDPGGGEVYIMDDDQVTVTADVNATLTFDIDVQTACGSESAAPYTVALGSLSPSSVTTAASKICLDLDTNAAAGAVVTVQGSGAQDGLESAAASDSVVTAYAPGNAGLTDLLPGTDGFGLCVESTSAVTGSATGVAPYNGVCNASGGDRVGGVDSAAPQQILTTNAAAVDGTANDTAALRVKASISTTTSAANDYTDVLTFVATGTF